MPTRRAFLALMALGITSVAAAAGGRPLDAQDWLRFRPVYDIHLAPDGASVAYLVNRYDAAADESQSDLWTVPWAGGAARQLTHGESVSDPAFTPDGREITFLSARPKDGPSQLWAVPRQGGAPHVLSHVRREIAGYAWAPDGEHVVLVTRGEEQPAAKAKGKDKDKQEAKPKPIVLDAYQFKADKSGYLTAAWRSHLYLLEVKTGRVSPLPADPQRIDSDPAFSPDGKSLAFVGHTVGTPAQVARDDIYVLGMAAGAAPRLLLSTDSPNHQHLEWSPDGARLSLLVGAAELKYNAYITDRLAVADAKSGELRLLATDLDRAVGQPKFTRDGSAIEVTVEDDGEQYPAQVALADGRLSRLGGAMVVHELTAAAGHTAVLSSSDQAPPEVFALEDQRLRVLTHHNDALFAQVRLGSVEDIAFKDPSGVEVHGQIVKPPDYVAGRRYPTILWIHGGPNGQDDHSLELWGYGPPLERQYFATHGYVVLAINYRGGSGRGAAYARAIAADWGDKEVEDLRAGVDWAIAQGIADPERLGIGGWSYGGILTDYTIASDPRFKAAISGAGSANQLSMYGADEYVVQYNAELGPPWTNSALWLKVSYPFFHADRIHTPTLFLGGDRDFNVPLAGGEQMYQALKTLGVPAQLVVYPGEYHVLTRPSFLIDRTERYLAWMDRYLKAKP
ncbi:MAG: S9 family peptidase [Proteobacteria bacterium]|nr:S9 family peptidase [Pseudomonadota bacterium]